MVEFCMHEKHGGVCNLTGSYCNLGPCPNEDIKEFAPVRHGRWVDNGACGYKWAFYCSKCGYIDGYPFNDRHNYCPNCGAKMDKSTD